jgi:hypothetical protein
VAQGNWPSELGDLPDLAALGVDEHSHVSVYQRWVKDIPPGIQTVASPGFTACSGVIVRDNTVGRYTFGHLQPGVMSFERHMEGRQLVGGEAVMLFGELSYPPDVLWDLRAGRWGDIDTKVISFESGATWWAALFNVLSGEVKIA